MACACSARVWGCVNACQAKWRTPLQSRHSCPPSTQHVAAPLKDELGLHSVPVANLCARRRRARASWGARPAAQVGQLGLLHWLQCSSVARAARHL